MTSAPGTAGKPIRLTSHAIDQCAHRGTTPAEVVEAIGRGGREPAKKGRWIYRYNVKFDGEWAGRHYAIKQVAPVVAEDEDQCVVVTVYTFFF